jgi:hypothetical protein
MEWHERGFRGSQLEGDTRQRAGEAIKVQPQPAPPGCGFFTSATPNGFGAVSLVLRYHYEIVMISKAIFSMKSARSISPCDWRLTDRKRLR